MAGLTSKNQDDLDAMAATLRLLLLTLSAEQDAQKLLNRAVEDHPAIACLKEYDEASQTYIARAFSRKYVLNVIGGNASRYLNKSDFSFWPPDKAATYFARDEEVRLKLKSRSAGGAHIGPFESPVRSQTTNEEGVFRCIKYGFEYRGRVFILMLGDLVFDE